MSESSVHKALVLALYDDVVRANWESCPFVYADMNGASTPPLIGSSRPDVYASFPEAKYVIIGEAKTGNDIESRHTIEQLFEYFEHITVLGSGELWIAVPWLNAGTALRVCSNVKKRVASPNRFKVSAWMLGQQNYSKAWYG